VFVLSSHPMNETILHPDAFICTGILADSMPL
jgi:hypothetical protein